MNTITIKNLSTLTDCAAVARVGRLLAGEEYSALRDGFGNVIIAISRRGNCFTVSDAD